METDDIRFKIENSADSRHRASQTGCELGKVGYPPLTKRVDLKGHVWTRSQRRHEEGDVGDILVVHVVAEVQVIARKVWFDRGVYVVFEILLEDRRNLWISFVLANNAVEIGNILGEKVSVTSLDCAVRAGKNSVEELKLTGRLTPSKTRFCLKLVTVRKLLNSTIAQMKVAMFNWTILRE